MTPIEQVRAALEEIGKGVDLIDCSGPAANQNIAAVTKLILPELKRALAAIDRMEPALIRAAALEEAARVAMDHPSGSYTVAAAIRALKERPTSM
jgi:hypothetical protein